MARSDSNGSTCARRYQLLHLVRTHAGAKDEAYWCVFQEEDDDGIVGVSLSKELMQVAGAGRAKGRSCCPVNYPCSTALSS